MGLKIKKIFIKNFKIYNEKTIDFEDKNLLVLDGPNGFGKTSIFDAIELLFTGKIRRYEKTKSILIDGRKRRNENPFYNINGDGGDIIIKALIEFDSIEYVIARVNSNIKNSAINFKEFELYNLNDFEDVPSDENKTSDDFFVSLLGENYKSDFEFVNYVEQEETFYYLKSPEKDKKENINYLFNTKEFNDKIDKFSVLNERLKNSIYGENGLDDQIVQTNKQLDEIKESFKSLDGCEYLQLFNNKIHLWDEEKINFDSISYNEILGGEDGVLNKIADLVINKDEFFNEIQNNEIHKMLEDQEYLSSFLDYEYFREKELVLNDERLIYNEFVKIENEFKEFQIDNVLESNYDLSERILERFPEDRVLIEYSTKLKDLKKEISNSNNISIIFTRLISARELLINHSNDYHKEIKDDGTCPLCGFDWITSEELLRNFEKQKEDLELVNQNIDQSLKIKTEDLKSFFEEELLTKFQSIIKEFLYDKDFFKRDFFQSDLKRHHTFLKIKLDELKIDYKELISKNVNQSNLDNLELLKQELTGKIKTYNPELIKPIFKEVFDFYFDSKIDNLKEMPIEFVNDKKRYINYSFSIFQSDLIKVNEIKLDSLKEKKEKLLKPLKRIQSILTIMNKSLNWYNNQLIKDIEVLFHIYSGRIVQDFQGGIGLFIIVDGNGIKFVTSPDKTYDAVFSMSTGQLSALVLSFTLSLNKKYSKSKMLFIDDPVQSMDDINTAGFVEVLRNDFSDRQIVFSTHEHTMSTYIRYKFKKFGIESTRLDLSINN